MKDPSYFEPHANRKQTSGEGKHWKALQKRPGRGTANYKKGELIFIESIKEKIQNIVFVLDRWPFILCSLDGSESIACVRPDWVITQGFVFFVLFF